MGKQRCFVLIDGSNFYFKLKDLQLHHLLAFNFSAFAQMVSGKNIVSKGVYYVGAVRNDGTERVQKMFNDQRRLLAYLKKHHFSYSLGYLLKSDGRFHEKGVDVNMAVDMLIATYENLCDRIILVTSDTDLLPAIKQSREKGKTVEYVGFSHAASLAMVANCNESRLLKREDLQPFIIVEKK